MESQGSAGLISIIVPVYNVRPYLGACMESILSQTYGNFEVLLVDDGSTDGSSEEVDAWAERDGRVRCFHKSNGGLSSARNYALDRAKGQYITCIDSDDYVDVRYLETLLALLEKYPQCGFSSCNFYVVGKRGKRLSPQSPAPEMVVSREDAFRDVLYHGYINVSACGKLYRRELFDEIRYPEGLLYEDTYVFGDLLMRTSEVAFSNEPLYYYMKRSGSIVSGGFAPSRLQFIDAVDRLIESAMKCSGALDGACQRRWVHARLSVLRYMDGCEAKYEPQRDSLRRECLGSMKVILDDPEAPRRDKIALRLLSLGYAPFFFSWRTLERLR